MNSAPIRRAQAVAPFGTGALYTTADGTAMITAGLDHWYKREDGSYDKIDLGEFRIEEWRLQKILGVSQLRLPPDYREPYGFTNPDEKNLSLSLPFLRFPLWHFCSRCRSLLELGPTIVGRQRCPVCARKTTEKKWKGRAPLLSQVPFIAICEEGHLQDFPWREWVHRSLDPGCDRQMRLVATGGASLAAQQVKCECGVEPRNLSQITSATTNSDGQRKTHLTDSLSREGPYVCRGARPWLADHAGVGCGGPLRGSLRAATNVYYAHVESTIYLPRGDKVEPKLLEILTQPPLAVVLQMYEEFDKIPSPDDLRAKEDGYLLDGYSDDEVTAGLDAVRNPPGGRSPISDKAAPDDRHTLEQIRRPEFAALRHARDANELLVNERTLEGYDEPVRTLFSRVNQVERLRETRALYGFSRVLPESGRPYRTLRAMLWKDEPSYIQNWLPAYVVRGEGLYFEFEEDRIAEWEGHYAARAERLARNDSIAREARGLEARELLPRYVLIHTFAHILINRLIFEAGYSSASLRERLYVATGAEPMAGLLIYTAAGDSEGTMGGLVRLGRPGNLEPVIQAALDQARWCSADPVCMELGEHGQGPDACNLAACHSCALLPETACEVFNRFLDRGAIVGSHTDPRLGYFTATR